MVALDRPIPFRRTAHNPVLALFDLERAVFGPVVESIRRIDHETSIEAFARAQFFFCRFDDRPNRKRRPPLPCRFFRQD